MINEDLKKSADLMLSSDYKERFKAEYMQLKTRCEGLKVMLDKYIAGTLTFKPTCSILMLSEQLAHMKSYLISLDERARLEGIDITY